MEELRTMSIDQLTVELKTVESALEDLIEERDFTLRQTGVHLNAARATALRNEWERDEKKYRDKIRAITDLLQAGSLTGGR